MFKRLAEIVSSLRQKGWRSPEALLLLMGAAAPLSFSTWMALLNNFTIEKANFTGAEIGMLQTLREIPGFLAFTAIFVLLIIKEQRFALVSLMVLGIGTAITGYFPSVIGLYCTTVLMSIGFHYNETIQQSLALQWLGKDRAPIVLGRVIAAASVASLLAYALIWSAFQVFGLEYKAVYVIGGGATVALALLAWFAYPQFPEKVEQHKKIILRKRYWLYYALTFMSGARRQIFVVFAGFMMVEKFGYSVANITLLFLINYAANIWLAPAIGRLIKNWGERRALTLEYIGLIFVFTSYAFVENEMFAAALYVIDHLFFAMAIAIKTYFQKISDPKDIAPTAAVSFTINHIAAVVLPVLLGFVWLVSPTAVFLTGAAFALCSLILTQLIPKDPQQGQETTLTSSRSVPQAAE
ncbi:MFS transporter [Rhodovibrionaceae bacterium A322]